MRTTGRRNTTSPAYKKQGPGKNSACPLISSRSPHTRSDQSEPIFAGIRPTDVPPFRAAQIVGARFAFFVSLAHVKDRLKQGDGVFESGLENCCRENAASQTGCIYNTPGTIGSESVPSAEITSYKPTSRYQSDQLPRTPFMVGVYTRCRLRDA